MRSRIRIWLRSRMRSWIRIHIYNDAISNPDCKYLYGKMVMDMVTCKTILFIFLRSFLPQVSGTNYAENYNRPELLAPFFPFYILVQAPVLCQVRCYPLLRLKENVQNAFRTTY
jgi:hypothetical protein